MNVFGDIVFEIIGDETDVYYTGGIAGYNSGNIENCNSNVNNNISGKGIFNTGGIAGYNGGTVSRCSNSGSISECEASAFQIGDYHLEYIIDENHGDIVIPQNSTDDIESVHIVLQDSTVTGSSPNGTIYDLGTHNIVIESNGMLNTISNTGGGPAINAPNSNVYITGNGALVIKGSDGQNGLDGQNGTDNSSYSNGLNGGMGYNGTN